LHTKGRFVSSSVSVSSYVAAEGREEVITLASGGAH
jgi:hypothetical protein